MACIFIFPIYLVWFRRGSSPPVLLLTTASPWVCMGSWWAWLGNISQCRGRVAWLNCVSFFRCSILYCFTLRILRYSHSLEDYCLLQNVYYYCQNFFHKHFHMNQCHCYHRNHCSHRVSVTHIFLLNKFFSSQRYAATLIQFISVVSITLMFT